jgi:hypothetical protein
MDRELQAVGSAGDWSGYGLGQSGEKAEEIEGMLGRCSPRHGRGEAAGNPRQPKTGAAARASRVAAIRQSSGVGSVLDRRDTLSRVSW